MAIGFMLVSLVLVSGLNYGAALFPFQNPKLPWDQRVDDLVNRLTLDEIAPQTIADYGKATPSIPRLGIKPYVWITECVRGQDHTNTTAFPSSLGLAASWNHSLLYYMAEAISYEVRAHWNGNRRQGQYQTFSGLSCFSPVINIARHPLWGRNQESYGECPHLSGRLAQHFVAGLQGEHQRYARVTAGCKHFDVHGGPENIPVNRASFDAKVSMRDWRMTFLPAFKMCVEAGTYSLMCSYNRINGVPSCANGQLLTNITRDEWGFRGYIVSDAGAISNIMTKHNYTKNQVDTVTVAIRAGTNLELGSSWYQQQGQALKQGNLTEDQLRQNVKPLMYTRMRLGEFDPEDMNPYASINMSVVQSVQHRQLAVSAAQQTFVLLKNSNKKLPLQGHFNKVAVVGPMANNSAQLFGDYGSTVLPQFTTTPLHAAQMLGSQALLASGCSDTKCQSYDDSSVMMAVNGSDLVLVCLGTGQDVESEGNDRSTLDLPGRQLDLLKDAVYYAQGKTVILLLFNAGPLDVTWAELSPQVDAILACFFPAQSTGQAVYNVLTMNGPNSVPAGRLPMTWPADLSQVPPITDYGMDGHTYRYYHGHPLYPFGFGLSYSSFMYSDMMLSSTSIKQGSDVQVQVKVNNLGPYDADEVVQLYFSWPSGPVVPKWQLVSFHRLHVPVNVPQVVVLTIRNESMQAWMDDNTGWAIPTGEATVYVGGQQPNQRKTAGSNVLKGSFMITS